MNSETAPNTHPAFVEVIRQMAPGEAKLFAALLPNLPMAAAQLRLENELGHGFDVADHVLDLRSIEEVPPHNTVATWVDNWSRLGLVELNYLNFLVSDGAYSYVETHEAFLTAQQLEAKPNSDGMSLKTTQGHIALTHFGLLFARIVCKYES
jgi:hypothetical protein